MKIFLGYDRRGEKLALHLAEVLTEMGHEVNIPLDEEESHKNYPVQAEAVCKNVLKNKDSKGLLVCGTGVGMMMASNRFEKIRAVLAWEPAVAYFAKRHENANVLVLAGGYKDDKFAVKQSSKPEEILKVFLETEFEGDRHEVRIKMLDEIAKK